jgi:hypothetical protein
VGWGLYVQVKGIGLDWGPPAVEICNLSWALVHQTSHLNQLSLPRLHYHYHSVSVTPIPPSPPPQHTDTSYHSVPHLIWQVSLDDPSLQPEDVQNMVHEALFQQYVAAGAPVRDKGGGSADVNKRARV